MQKAAPSPPPKTPMARRLEYVRTNQAGGISLAEFHRRLTAGWSAGCGRRASYEAARTYHYDRDAPASYLDRVAEVFGVRLEWLVAGRGARTAAEADAASIATQGAADNINIQREQPADSANVSSEELERAFTEGLPALGEGADLTAWYALADLHSRRALADLHRIEKAPSAWAKDHKRGAQAFREMDLEMARETAAMVGAGARAAEVDLASLSPWQRSNYIQLACQALGLLFVEPHEIAARPGASYTIGERPGLSSVQRGTGSKASTKRVQEKLDRKTAKSRNSRATKKGGR